MPENELLPKTRTAVKHPLAETYIFVSLVSFALTVIVTRVFLELAGYPQVGNSVLHIAHALWGGLLLFVAALLTLVMVNRWAFTLSALLSGIGVGLFIDEVGKFITQKNDYFFPPAAPLIYSIFLLMVLFFLLVRGSRQSSPRTSMYRVLYGFHEILDNDLDPREKEYLLAELENSRTAKEPHITLLAERLADYLQQESISLVPYRPSLWQRFNQGLQVVGAKLGRKNHFRLIAIITALLSLNALLTVLLFVLVWLLPQVTVWELLLTEAETLSVQNPTWLVVRLVLQTIVGGFFGIALLWLMRRREHVALKAAIFGSLLSLTTVDLLTFYLDQFGALASVLANLALFLLLLTYRNWYLSIGTE